MTIKVHLTYKSPDAVHYALERLHPDEQERAIEVIREALGSTEYVDIEIDLDTGEAQIIKRKAGW